MLPAPPANPAAREAPVHVWIHVAILAVMWALHALLVLSVVINAASLAATAPTTFGPSPFEQGEFVGRITGVVLAGGFALVGLPWVPLNAYGLITGKRWARPSLVAYWIVCGLSVCCAPFAIYPLISLWRPSMKAWFVR